MALANCTQDTGQGGFRTYSQAVTADGTTCLFADSAAMEATAARRSSRTPAASATCNGTDEDGNALRVRTGADDPRATRSPRRVRAPRWSPPCR
ncbi:hypothetical protein SCYAM73S_08281 [Streptomyces cyaneofuscatus]